MILSCHLQVRVDITPQSMLESGFPEPSLWNGLCVYSVVHKLCRKTFPIFHSSCSWSDLSKNKLCAAERFVTVTRHRSVIKTSFYWPHKQNTKTEHKPQTQVKSKWIKTAYYYSCIIVVVVKKKKCFYIYTKNLSARYNRLVIVQLFSAPFFNRKTLLSWWCHHYVLPLWLAAEPQQGVIRSTRTWIHVNNTR